MAGLVIAGIGLFFLAGQLEPDIGRFVTMFIGLALLAVFVVTREYGFLVPGSILTGVGIGIVLDSAASGEAESGVMMLAIAGGFLGIWVLGSIYRSASEPLVAAHPRWHPDAHRVGADDTRRRRRRVAAVARHPHRGRRFRAGQGHHPPGLTAGAGDTRGHPRYRRLTR